ncbi:MAG TPA: hypothetical protein VKG79_14430, partial [Bryobacteraceae bacterium]|nr:hypothetical protein [Bryobacteraceae bacterium]
MTQSNYILVYIDNVLYASVYDTSISSGQPGVGVEGAYAGNGFTTLDIGHLDTVAPNPVTSISGTAFSDRVDLQWPTTTDDPNGIGIAYYTIWRNSTQIGETTSTYFSDFGAAANNTYAYAVKAVDYHWNTASTSQNITTPATVIDPRETGVRPTGSYWGGGGEQIDVRSGNLNFTVPMLKGVGRGGWSVGFNLTYNSQNWRQDTAGTWQLGLDTGYGYGWRFQAGSLTPLYSSAWVAAGYLFIDATGAEYHLTVNNSGVWTSIESIYVYFDSTAGKLHFTDGSFWTFGSTSATTEQDAGTMYPTLMEDRNGNQVAITYDNGAGLATVNTSSRINTIEDVRGNGSADYTFTYTSLNVGDPFPHLTGITNSIQTGEKYSFVYSDSSLISPFDHVTSFGTFAFLQSSTQRHMNPVTFAYDTGGSGELDEVTVPYGGHLRWTYAPSTLANTLTYREVQNRYLSMSAGAAETLITLIRGNDSTYNVHQSATLDDSPANSEKYWTFQTDTTQFNGGLQLSYEERTLATHTPLSHLDFTWAQTPTTLNPYIGTTVTKLDPGQTYEADKQTTQTLDQYGNLTQVLAYNFGAGAVGSLARTYTNSYGTNSGYLPYYIFNRLLKSTVTDGTNTATLVQNGYDGNSLTTVTGLYEHDANYSSSFTYRGNITSSSTPTKSTSTSYDIAGNVTSTSTNGVTTNVTTGSTTNYAAPTQVTTNTLGSGMTWSSFLGLSSATGPNGDTGSLNYDVTGRPSYVYLPYGAVTSYTYNDTQSPPNKSAST